MVVANVGGTVFLDVEKVDDLLCVPAEDGLLVQGRAARRHGRVRAAVDHRTGHRTRCWTSSTSRCPPTVAALGEGFVRRASWPGQSAVDLLVPRAELALVVAADHRRGRPAGGQLRVRGVAGRVAAAPARRRHRRAHDPARGRPDRPGRAPRQGLLPRPGDGREGPQRGTPAAADAPTPPGWFCRTVQPETGDPVTLDGRVVGRVGTVALHHELGPIALALVKRSVPLEAGPAGRRRGTVVAGTHRPRLGARGHARSGPGSRSQPEGMTP